MPKILVFVVNDLNFFLSHRLPVAIDAKEAGYEVHVATAAGSDVSLIDIHGLTQHTLPLSRSGRNPFSELWALCDLIKLFRTVKPDIVHLVTIKPVLYGGIAARLTLVPAVVSAVSGLGSVFVSKGVKAGVILGIVGLLYRLAFGHRNLKVIFQNPDDRDTLCRNVGLPLKKTTLIRGSGVSLDAFTLAPEPEGKPIVCFAARLLRDKGVFELIQAARLLNERGSKARFWVVGDPDPGNPSTATENDLEQWRKEGVVEVMGYNDDIPSLLTKSHIIALPSYREGLPKTLIEAAAAGRAVVTTDVPGCRDAITPNETGLLVPPRDAHALADAIEYLIENPDKRQAMGRAGRKLAEEAFDVRQVVAAHMKIYEELLESATAR